MDESVIEVAHAIDALNWRGMQALARELGASLGVSEHNVAQALSDWADRIVKAGDEDSGPPAPLVVPQVLVGEPAPAVEPVVSGIHEHVVESTAAPDAPLEIPEFLKRQKESEAAAAE